jgi:Na+/proline symporter
MISFLTGLPLWLSGMLIVGLPTALAMFGPILVRRYVTAEKLAENNEVAGFKFSVVGVLYAVLLAFAIIVVWERFSDAENNVAREAGTADFGGGGAGQCL